MLNPQNFRDGIKILDFIPKTDLFASRINNQLKYFVSYRPDPDAVSINAFTLDWGNLCFYAFPPFLLLYVFTSITKDPS